MNTNVDSPKLLQYKNNAKVLSFSIIIWDQKGQIVVPGFRLMDGRIHPPNQFRRSTKTWEGMIFLAQPLAEQLYKEIEDAGWVSQFNLGPLAPVDIAVEPILVTRSVAWKYAPSLV